MNNNDNNKDLTDALTSMPSNIKYKAYIKKNIFEMAFFYIVCIFVLNIILGLLKFTYLTKFIDILNQILYIGCMCFVIFILVKNIIQQINTSVFITSEQIIIKVPKSNIVLNNKDVQFIENNTIVCNDIYYNLYYISDFNIFREEFIETLNSQQKQELVQRSQEFYIKYKLVKFIQKNKSLIKVILYVLSLILIIVLILTLCI